MLGFNGWLEDLQLLLLKLLIGVGIETQIALFASNLNYTLLYGHWTTHIVSIFLKNYTHYTKTNYH
jgi:hypothetical protein